MKRKRRARAASVITGLALMVTACTPASELADCERSADAGRSVARIWDEELLGAIRRDFPAPTVHSRNLFHLSAAMWDAWAAYDPVAIGYFVDEEHEAGDVQVARETAISYAAYRILTYRYAASPGAPETMAALDETMKSLCLRTDFTSTEGDSPAALGNRIAATVITFGRTDGSLESAGYLDPTYEPVNEPMVVAQAGTVMNDPNRWQPLALEVQIAQNGLPIPSKVQAFVGPHWGNVAGFAIPTSLEGLPLDPGPPPNLGDPESDAAFKEEAVVVIRYSSWLDPSDSETLNAGPGSLGDNTLGANDGDGYELNPATGQPYAVNEVRRGDFLRAVTEFWADGPQSETPPGHWNTLANAVSDHPGLTRRIGGAGPEVDRLEWDVKLYLVLNGALHDAAIAAWGAKGFYDSVRPISMIRYMGGLGQSSDPNGPSYHPDGMTLEPGLIELITTESSAPGQRHSRLAGHAGEIAIQAWLGNPEDPESEVGGVDWSRAVEWVPYQRSTFVTPAFAGYVSGHSTFSRAAAEVLTSFTASPYFPEGLSQWTIPAGGLEVEAGPARAITLQWATYYDAADQAGISRLIGGIHIPADDFAGRRLGAQCGQDAWELAQTYYEGTAPTP